MGDFRRTRASNALSITYGLISFSRAAVDSELNHSAAMSNPPPGINKEPLENASQMLKGTDPPVKQKSTSPFSQVTLDLSTSSFSPNPLPVRTEDDMDIVYDGYLDPADSASNIEHMEIDYNDYCFPAPKRKLCGEGL